MTIAIPSETFRPAARPTTLDTAPSHSARLLHPSAAIEAATTLPLDALHDIASGLARVDRSVPLDELAERSTPRSICLIATPAYDVWLVTWPPGTGMDLHDHGLSTSVTRIVSGTLVTATLEGAGGRLGPARPLGPESAVVTHPSVAHLLRNPTAGEATSIHVYSPPLAGIAYPPFDRTGAATGETAGSETSVRRRPRAEATSSDVLARAATGPAGVA